MELQSLLKKMVAENASDLFLSVGAPPTLSIEGRLYPQGESKLDPEQAKTLIHSALSEKQIEEFEENLELNLALQMGDLGRFRCNVYRQRGQLAMAVRYICNDIPQMDELGLPKVLKALALEKRGLVLAVGATGTGKSTTLASMIDFRAQQQDGHILAIEDPIEYLHQHRRSLVDQREVGLDTHSYASALKNALREAPDAIMIGEIRDTDTMRHALNYAETGHLCLSTLHASNASQTLERILGFYPENAQEQVRIDVAQHLKAIISQRLAIGLDGKRVAAVEIMINTPFISELIAQGKIDQIHTAMAKSGNHGCQTFDDALYKLWEEGLISQEEAEHNADSRNNMALRFRLDQNLAGTPIHKEVQFNHEAPFTLYHSFRLQMAAVDDPRQRTLGTMLHDGMLAAMTARGFRASNDQPDLELLVNFNLKNIQDLTLAPVENEQSLRPNSHTEGEIQLIIKDRHTERPVWRLHARTELNLAQMDQSHINALCRALFEDFPPKN